MDKKGLDSLPKPFILCQIFIIIMKLLQILIEGDQGSLYHYTSANNILNILKTNTFNLSSNIGTRADEFGKKFFFLSTTRTSSPAIGYGENKAARITLDTGKLKDNHQIIPVDYWQQRNPQKVAGFGDPNQRANWEWGLKKNAEFEDRILSNKPVINNATKYIEQIDLVLDRGHINDVIEIVNIAKNNNIVVNVYPSDQDFIKKRNPLDLNNLTPVEDKDKYVRDEGDPFYNYENLFAIVLYDKKYTNDYNTFEPIFKEFVAKHKLEDLNISGYKVFDIMRNLGYRNSDTILGLKSNLHNFFKSGENRGRIRELITLLTSQMTKAGTKNIEDFVDLKVNGIKPKYFQKYDYSKALQVVRLEDDYVIPNDTKTQSGRPSVYLRSDSRYIDKADGDKFYEIYERDGTLAEVLNYLFNTYSFDMAKKKFELGTYDWDNKPQYKIVKL